MKIKPPFTSSLASRNELELVDTKELLGIHIYPKTLRIYLDKSIWRIEEDVRKDIRHRKIHDSDIRDRVIHPIDHRDIQDRMIHDRAIGIHIYPTRENLILDLGSREGTKDKKIEREDLLIPIYSSRRIDTTPSPNVSIPRG